MGKQILVLALLFFAAFGMATAAFPSPYAAAPSAEDKGSEHVIGSVSEGAAPDAAPIGAPVPAGAFPNLSPTATPSSGAAAAANFAGAIAVAGVVGSVFFF